MTRLRSAVGERGKWSEGGETAGTELERNAAAEPQTEARRFCGVETISFVTSAWFEERNGWGRKGYRANLQPVERSKPCVGHGVNGSLAALRLSIHAVRMLRYRPKY